MCACNLIVLEVFLVVTLSYIVIVLEEQEEPSFQVGILVNARSASFQ